MQVALKNRTKAFLLHSAVLGALMAGGSASAQERPWQAPVTTEETSRAAGPNMAMVGSGLGVLALSYAPAVVVGARSGLHGDRTLGVPVAGPWIDLSQRPNCGLDNSCNTENTTRVLLVTDGIFQALGALTVVGGFLTTSHRTTKIVRSKSAHLTLDLSPAQLYGGGYGVVALGKF